MRAPCCRFERSVCGRAVVSVEGVFTKGVSRNVAKNGEKQSLGI